MLKPACPIATERLLLRPFAAGDLDALVPIHGRPDAVRYLCWEPRGREELVAVLAEKQRRTVVVQEGDALNLAAVRRDTNELIGDVTLFWRSERHRGGELGYIFTPDHRRGDLRAARPRVARGRRAPQACCGRVSALTKSSSWRVVQHSCSSQNGAYARTTESP